MDKAPDAFRTISEVADDLDIPAHVLRFWETRFVQIKPMKRSGGRRYYRPDDVHLLRGIRRLLYGEGYTIRGVQRILREHGIKAVQGILDDATIVPESFAGPALDDEHGGRGHRAAHNGAEDADNEADVANPDFDDEEEDDIEPVPQMARGTMDFVPSQRLTEPVMVRPIAARPLPDIPVAAMPAVPKPVPPKPVSLSPANGAPNYSGLDAYAPPSIRKGARIGDRGKLQSALDDLIGARELIDRVLKE